jgi:hypothetical protein
MLAMTTMNIHMSIVTFASWTTLDSSWQLEYFTRLITLENNEFKS